jgi:hypothetical protein
MEKIKIRLNEFKKFAHSGGKPRAGLLIEVNNEGIIGILPSREDPQNSFLLFEDGIKNQIGNDFQFEVADDEEISVIYKTVDGIEINVSGETRSNKYFIPVKNGWTVEFRNRRSMGGIIVCGSTIHCNIRRKG